MTKAKKINITLMPNLIAKAQRISTKKYGKSNVSRLYADYLINLKEK